VVTRKRGHSLRRHLKKGTTECGKKKTRTWWGKKDKKSHAVQCQICGRKRTPCTGHTPFDFKKSENLTLGTTANLTQEGGARPGQRLEVVLIQNEKLLGNLKSEGQAAAPMVGGQLKRLKKRKKITKGKDLCWGVDWIKKCVTRPNVARSSRGEA